MDDFIRAGLDGDQRGGTLDDLHVLRREPRPTEAIVDWLEQRGHPRDLSILRTTGKIQALSVFPPSNPLKTTARILDVEKKRQAAVELEELVRWGAITITKGSLGVGRFYKGRSISEEWAEHEEKWRRDMHARATLDWIDRPHYGFAEGLEAVEDDPIPLRHISDTIPYRGRPLQEERLAKTGPIDEILDLAADQTGTSVHAVLRDIGRDKGIWIGRKEASARWRWMGDGDPTAKDVRDFFVWILSLYYRLEPKDIAPRFGLSPKQVERILLLPEVKREIATGVKDLARPKFQIVDVRDGASETVLQPGHDPV